MHSFNVTQCCNYCTSSNNITYFVSDNISNTNDIFSEGKRNFPIQVLYCSCMNYLHWISQVNSTCVLHSRPVIYCTTCISTIINIMIKPNIVSSHFSICTSLSNVIKNTIPYLPSGTGTKAGTPCTMTTILSGPKEDNITGDIASSVRQPKQSVEVLSEAKCRVLHGVI